MILNQKLTVYCCNINVIAENDKTNSKRKYSPVSYSTCWKGSKKEGPWNTAVDRVDYTVRVHTIVHSRHDETECHWWGKKVEVQVSSLSHSDRISSATSCALSVQLWLLCYCDNATGRGAWERGVMYASSSRHLTTTPGLALTLDVGRAHNECCPHSGYGLRKVVYVYPSTGTSDWYSGSGKVLAPRSLGSRFKSRQGMINVVWTRAPWTD